MGKRSLWSRFRHLAGRPIAPVLPVINPLQTVNPFYLFVQVLPVVRHGIKEMDEATPRHVLTETSMIAYLMGVGYDYRTARAIVESWELDSAVYNDGLLIEGFAIPEREQEDKE